jgi:hypothetical protein
MTIEAKTAYEQLLRQLHVEVREGREEGPDAERIRDEMDPLWYNLTKEEQQDLATLSDQLYARA